MPMQWLQNFIKHLTRWLFPPKRHYRLRRGALAHSTPSHKPTWIRHSVLAIKANIPHWGCRKIATAFNRANYPHTVGKSTVANILQQHRYQIAHLRERCRNRMPNAIATNHTWGLDLTQVGAGNATHLTLGVIDHGSRALLALQALPTKATWYLLAMLCLCVAQFGKPKNIRTDNERMFTGKWFGWFLKRMGIRHQKTQLHSPWQNGRIERLFGTLKESIKGLQLQTTAQVEQALGQFQFVYNHIRPHQYLNGKTPAEAWNKTNIEQHPKQTIKVRGLNNYLSGDYLRW